MLLCIIKTQNDELQTAYYSKIKFLLQMLLLTLLIY